MDAVNTLFPPSPQVWLRGRVRFEPPDLVLHDPEVYEIPAGPEIVTEVLRVRSPGDAEAFGRLYGLLTVGPDSAPVLRSREPWATFQMVGLQMTRVLGLAYHLRRAYEGHADARGTLEALYRGGDFGRQVTGLPSAADDARFFAQVQDLLSRVLSGFLEGTEEVVEPSPWRDGHFVMSARSPDLQGRVWREVAAVVVGHEPIRSCEDRDCGIYFRPTDSRQRFCSRAHQERTRRRRAREEAHSSGSQAKQEGSGR